MRNPGMSMLLIVQRTVSLVCWFFALLTGLAGLACAILLFPLGLVPGAVFGFTSFLLFTFGFIFWTDQGQNLNIAEE